MGRWPLWEPGENGGTPLLSNPLAAVLYPGKVLYALLTYAWAARTYVIAHTVIAFLGMLALGRSCGVSWMTNVLVLAAWAAAGIGIARRWHRRPGEARLAPLLSRLAGASTLALALAAAQVLPALEFAADSRRVAGDAAINIYRFSLDPYRVVELIWPNVFRTPRPINRSWVQAIPPAGTHELLNDSLYVGGLTLVLALSASGLRCGPPWRAWLTVVMLVGLAGWDRATAGETRWLGHFARFGLGASLVGLALALVSHAAAVSYLTRRVPPDAGFGPADIAGSWAETQRALGHGVVVFGAVLALARWAPRRPRIAGTIAVMVMAADLSVANSRLVWTAPQSAFDAPSEAAERSDPSPGPFRVHRMSSWYPAYFSTTRSAQRFRELIDWTRPTRFIPGPTS